MRVSRILLLAAIVFAGAANVWAQPNQQRQGGRGGGQRGGQGGNQHGGQGGAQRNWMGYYMWLRRFDPDGDLFVGEDEFATGMKNMQKSSDDAYELLLKNFDTNSDKTLDSKELQKARTFVYAIMGMQRYDKNRDFNVDEDEYRQAWEELSGRCQDFNDMMLDQFDKDRNGTLSAEELAPAKAEIENRSNNRGQRGGGGRGQGQR